MKHLTQLSIAITILLIATTTLTRAQSAPPGNPLPSVNKFNDIVEVNFSSMESQQGVLTMGLRNVFVLKHTDDFSFGIGLGLESYNSYGGGWGAFSVPLSADLRWYFKQKNKGAYPFLNLNGGYEPTFGNGEVNNGAFLGLNLGINIVAAGDVSLQLALGLKLDHYGLFTENGFNTTNYLSVPFTIGVAF